MMTELRFDGRTAIVTGAGGNPSMGRAHALLLEAASGSVTLRNSAAASALEVSGAGAVTITTPALESVTVSAGAEFVFESNALSLDGRAGVAAGAIIESHVGSINIQPQPGQDINLIVSDGGKVTGIPGSQSELLFLPDAGTAVPFTNFTATSGAVFVVVQCPGNGVAGSGYSDASAVFAVARGTTGSGALTAARLESYQGAQGEQLSLVWSAGPGALTLAFNPPPGAAYSDDSPCNVTIYACTPGLSL